MIRQSFQLPSIRKSYPLPSVDAFIQSVRGNLRGVQITAHEGKKLILLPVSPNFARSVLK